MKNKSLRRIFQIAGFFFLGMLNHHAADLFCWLWLDELSCSPALELFCEVWNGAKEATAHYLFSFAFYYIGIWGFVGSIILWIEEAFLKGWITRIIGVFEFFSTAFATVISIILIKLFGEFFGLFEFFEASYTLINGS